MGMQASSPRAPETDADICIDPAVTWLEATLPGLMRRLFDSESLDMPLLQLPLAQLRLAHALYGPCEAADDHGETMGRLSDRLGVKQNALTQAADRLISHGLAERLSDPADRRVVRLRLTDLGKTWVGERRSRRRARLQELWRTLSSAEREQMLAAVRALKQLADRLSPGVPPPESERCKSRIPPTIEETLRQLTI